jgi:hypothetical protein
MLSPNSVCFPVGNFCHRSRLDLFEREEESTRMNLTGQLHIVGAIEKICRKFWLPIADEERVERSCGERQYMALCRG